jgi:hypothetical protein
MATKILRIPFNPWGGRKTLYTATTKRVVHSPAGKIKR